MQKPNDQNQICDQWINGSNDLASLIDPLLFAETPQSDPPTTGLWYDIDYDEAIFEQWARDLEDQQQRMKKKIQRSPTRCALSSTTWIYNSSSTRRFFPQQNKKSVKKLQTINVLVI